MTYARDAHARAACAPRAQGRGPASAEPGAATGLGVPATSAEGWANPDWVDSFYRHSGASSQPVEERLPGRHGLGVGASADLVARPVGSGLSERIGTGRHAVHERRKHTRGANLPRRVLSAARGAEGAVEKPDRGLRVTLRSSQCRGRPVPRGPSPRLRGGRCARPPSSQRTW